MELYTCIKTFETFGITKPKLYCKYRVYTSRLDGKLKAVSDSVVSSEALVALTPNNTIEIYSEYLDNYFVKIDDHRSKIIDKIKKLNE